MIFKKNKAKSVEETVPGVQAEVPKLDPCVTEKPHGTVDFTPAPPNKAYDQLVKENSRRTKRAIMHLEKVCAALQMECRVTFCDKDGHWIGHAVVDGRQADVMGDRARQKLFSDALKETK